MAVDDPTLTNDRVLTDTATVTWDLATAGQVKANATRVPAPAGPTANGGNGSNWPTDADGHQSDRTMSAGL